MRGVFRRNKQFWSKVSSKQARFIKDELDKFIEILPDEIRIQIKDTIGEL